MDGTLVTTPRAELLDTLRVLERKVLWLSTYMIHHANHERESTDGLKVGGHQASSASMATLMTALYFHILRPEDRVAVKPHASPVFHAIQYLLGNQSLDNLQRFRAFGGAQSYPSRTKDTDDVDFSTGSVGLGVAMTGFAAMAQEYVHAKGWARNVKTDPAHGAAQAWPKGRMISLMGDAEIDEGNIHEALLEYWKHGLTNTWWVVDYNRQSLDSVVSDQLFAKVQGSFKNLGWEVIPIKYGRLLEQAFTEPGGKALEVWIDACPNQLYSALVFEGAKGWRRQLEADLQAEPLTLGLIRQLSDEALSQLMTNLGGHDLDSILTAFEGAPTDRPVCFIAYTIKGASLPFQGHKDNHAGLMTKAQMQELRTRHNINQGDEWQPLAGIAAPAVIERFLRAVPFNQKGQRRFTADKIPVPDLSVPQTKGEATTQSGFGKILDEISKAGGPLADRIVTTSPDVTVSTNLGPWVNRRGLFSMQNRDDVFRERGLQSMQKWAMSPQGQHIELGIAEMNLFLNLAALGLSHSLFGERLIPIGTLYDPFVMRGLDALNYACYQDARFMVVGTPSGLTLAPEGGAHQSIATPLIGMAQDGLAAFEPAYVDELAVIMDWAFRYMQRDGLGELPASERSTRWLRDDKGGSVYLRLSTRPLEQLQRPMTPQLREDIIQGGYWLRKPEAGTSLCIVAMGAVLPEAIAAAGLLAEDRRGVGLLVVTSADRLSAGWHSAARARERGDRSAMAHVEHLLDDLPRDAGIITVCDAYPETLSWIGGVVGHRVRALGPEHFGQSGSIHALYAHHGFGVEGILGAAEGLGGRRVRYRRT
jgi:pyruvate dehydrogenase E1 component